MKALVRLALGIAVLSCAPALRADDLFREDGPCKTNRNLIIGNSYYEGVQIVGRRPGGKVEISSKRGLHIVDEKRLPPLWSAAIDKREAAKKPRPEAKPEITPEEKEEQELEGLVTKMGKMRDEADEVVSIMPQRLGKSAGGSLVAVIIGFRRNRSEVLMSNGREIAWVKISYFTKESAQHLQGLDIKKEEAAYQKAKKEEERQQAEEGYSEVKKFIRERAAKEWPGDYKMQLREIERQERAWDKICYWFHKPPFGITKEEGDEIWERARNRWPGNYTMQVLEIEDQAEALSKLKQKP